MMSRSRIVALLSLSILFLSAVVFVVSANHTPPGLQAVGPVSPEHGFPVWYQDVNDITLELCLDNDVYCLLPIAPPFTFPTNFPDEAFYYSAAASMPAGVAGTAAIGLDLEAAFLNAVQDGDQMVFGRIRIRIDGLVPGESYTVTHPYGQGAFVADGAGAINVTEDIGNMAGAAEDPNFGKALNSHIGPFLTWDTTPPAPPPGYIGDPGVAHAVTGSPFGSNFFRVEGLDAGGTGATIIETDQFFVMGKLSTAAGVQPTRATYVRDQAGSGFIDVFAFSQPGQVIHVSGTGLNTTAMRGDGAGNYYARLAFSGAPPELSISNAGDIPPTEALITPVDQVTVTEALFVDGTTTTLTISAASSDQQAILTAYRADGTTELGVLDGGSLVLTVPPASVVVKSSMGGADTEQVQISGAAFEPLPLLAIAGPNQTVVPGATVTLDGTNSTGDIATYAWGQTIGTLVGLSNPDQPVTTFTAGDAGESYTFTLTVDDNPDVQAASTAVVVVTVSSDTALVADAGPDQGPNDQFVVQGATINLDGSGSTAGVTYQWTQIGGTTVTDLQNDNTVEPSFVLTDDHTPVEFQLDVTHNDATASDTVLITPLEDILNVASAQYRQNKNQWDIRGTATVLGAPAGLGNTVSVYRAEGRNAVDLIGTADVDSLGDWRLRTNVAGPLPGDQIYVVSSRGGSTQFAAQVRN